MSLSRLSISGYLGFVTIKLRHEPALPSCVAFWPSSIPLSAAALVCMQGFREELGHDGQLGTVDRIAELLYCWCAPQMEDAMCYERDYKIFEDRKKAEDTRVVQERRAGLIDRLLNAANKPGEKTKAEGTPVKEVAPAK